MACLEKNRAQRYPTVAEFAAELGPFAPNRAQVSVERVSRVLASAGMVAAASQPTSEAVGGEPRVITTNAGSNGGVVTSGEVTPAITGGPGGTQATWGRSTYRTPKGAGTALAAVGLLGLVVLGGGSLGLWAWLRAGSEEATVGAAASAVEEGSPALAVSGAPLVETPEVARAKVETPGVAPAESASAVSVASGEAPQPVPAVQRPPKREATPATVTRHPVPVQATPRPAPKPATHPAGSPPPVLYGDRK